MNEIVKASVQEKNLGSNIDKKITVPSIQKISTLGILVKPIVCDPIDMICMLLQIIVKVPLSELFRIDEHKSKDLSWLEEIGDNNSNIEKNAIQ